MHGLYLVVLLFDWNLNQPKVYAIKYFILEPFPMSWSKKKNATIYEEWKRTDLIKKTKKEFT